MSDSDEIIPVAKTVMESAKRIFTLITKGSYLAAMKEIANLFKITYVNHIKGKYITVKGKKIPLTAVICVAILGLYIISPSSDETTTDNSKPSISEAEMVAQLNYYNHDNIIIDKMYKCEEAVCGRLENTKDAEIAEVVIPVAFFNKEGALVYEGSVRASNVPPLETTEFKVPTQVPFDFFKLGVVTVK